MSDDTGQAVETVGRDIMHVFAVVAGIVLDTAYVLLILSAQTLGISVRLIDRELGRSEDAVEDVAWGRENTGITFNLAASIMSKNGEGAAAVEV